MALSGVRQTHQVQRLPIELVLFIKCVVKAHDLEDRCHGLVIEALAIAYVLHADLHLIETCLDLFNGGKVAIVLPAQAFELLLQPVSCLARLTNHFCKLLSKLHLVLGQGHDIDW